MQEAGPCGVQKARPLGALFWSSPRPLFASTSAYGTAKTTEVTNAGSPHNTINLEQVLPRSDVAQRPPHSPEARNRSSPLGPRCPGPFVHELPLCSLLKPEPESPPHLRKSRHNHRLRPEPRP